jgi:hypothetical protein
LHARFNPWDFFAALCYHPRSCWRTLMVDQSVEIAYVKSPLWRVVNATGAAVGGIGGPSQGMEIILHFTYEWVDIQKETFRANVNSATGAITVASSAQFTMAPLTKVEEVAVKMSTEGAVGLIAALLSQSSYFSDQQKQKLRDEFSKLAKA